MWKQNPSQDEPTTPKAPGLAMAGEQLLRRPLAISSAMAEDGMIGKTIVIKGEISGSGNLYIDGTVEGAIHLPENRVIVGGTGKVVAKITAREIVVHGTVTGNVEASEFLDLCDDGSLSGDALAHRISIEDGAHFKGKLERRRYLRYKVTAPVQFSRDGRQLTANLSNLSETGMTVTCQEPLETGVHVEFSMHLPDGPVVKGMGETIWSNAGGNVGIQFRNLSDGADLELSRWLAQRDDATAASMTR